MYRILVSGLINIETTVAIDGFPLTYFPVRFPFFGVRSTVSGVGYNVAKALRKLGNEPRLVSLIGPDPMGSLVRQAFENDGLPASYLSDSARETPQSVILFDPSGQRQIHVDLKDVQEAVLPESLFSEALDGADACALCNINFSRPYLKRVKESGRLIATDVHTLSDPDDSYNRDFMAAADILFLSDEALPARPDEVARELIGRYRNRVVVIGRGARGAHMAVRDDGFSGSFPAVVTRPVINTIGAGDALFSSFLHLYLQTRSPYTALRGALAFASYKIGATGAAEGFLTGDELDRYL